MTPSRQQGSNADAHSHVLETHVAANDDGHISLHAASLSTGGLVSGLGSGGQPLCQSGGEGPKKVMVEVPAPNAAIRTVCLAVS